MSSSISQVMGTALSTKRMVINDGTNFEIYKFYINSMVYSENFDGLLEGTATSTSLTDYDMKKRKLWQLLIDTQSSSTIKVVMDPSIKTGDVSAAWKALVNYYDSSSKMNLKHQISKWVHLKQNGRTIVEVVSEVNTLKDKIASAIKNSKESFEDALSTIILLESLDPQFSQLKQLLLLQDIKYEDCVKRVMAEAESITLQQSSDLPMVSSSNHYTSQALYTTSNNQDQKFCKYCKKYGHVIGECYGLKRKQAKAKLVTSENQENAPTSTNNPAKVWYAKECKSYKQALLANLKPAETNIATFEIDSGASAHYTNNLKILTEFNTNASHAVSLADGTNITTEGVGCIPDKLPQVHYVPSFSTNLLSVAKLNDQGIEVCFKCQGKVLLQDTKQNKILAIGYREGDSYKLDIRHRLDNKVNQINQNDLDYWHQNLAHPGPGRLYSFLKSNHIGNYTYNDIVNFTNNCGICSVCKASEKEHHDLHGKKSSTAPFQLVHLDIKVGPCISKSGNSFVLIIVDDFTRAKYAYPMKYKSETIFMVKKFFSEEVHSQGYQLLNLRCDNSKENKVLEHWCINAGVKIQFSQPYSSQTNGTVERSIQTLQLIARCITRQADLGVTYWDLAFEQAAFIDRLLTNVNNPNKVCPNELLKVKYDLKKLHPIGSICYVYQHGVKPNIMPTAKEGKFVGYGGNYYANYQVLLNTGEIVQSQNVTFKKPGLLFNELSTQSTTNDANDKNIDNFSNEPEDATNNDNESNINHIIYTNPTISNTEPDSSIINHSTVTDDTPNINATEISEENKKKNTEITKTTDNSTTNIKSINLPDSSTTNSDISDNIHDSTDDTIKKRVNEILQPSLRMHLRSNKQTPFIENSIKLVQNMDQLIQDPRYIQSIHKEVSELIQSNAIEIVDRPPNRKVIQMRWVHKQKSDGTIKSRLTPKGFQQVEDVDFHQHEVPAPTLYIYNMFIFMQIVLNRNMASKIVDIVGAFRLPILNEPVFAELPDGFIKDKTKVIQINNAINGLKQAAYYWYNKISLILKQLGFKPLISEPCIFIDDSNNIIAVYVDDIHVAASNQNKLDQIINELQKQLPCQFKDQSTYLGIHFTIENNQILFDQKDKIMELLEIYQMKECKNIYTPAEPNSKLFKNEEDNNEKFPYRELVGSLLWIARTTRPDIMYAVNQCGKFANNYNTTHVTALKRILQYLKTTLDYKLIFTKFQSPIQIVAYADADYAGEPDVNENAMKSTSGVVITLNNLSTIYCQSTLQSTIATSTAEAEYIAMASATVTIIHIRNVLNELNYIQTPTQVFCDNQSALEMIKSRIISSKSRQIKIQFHKIREYQLNKEINVTYIDTENNLADLMTKSLPKPRYTKLTQTLLKREEC